MSDLRIENARVVLPDRVTEPTCVWVQNGKIVCIGSCDATGIDTVDAEGGYLLAGFIDTHVHGGGGADFMEGTVEAFETVTATHLKHGTTMLAPTSMTATPQCLETFVTTYLQFLEHGRGGAKTMGLHLEGPYLSGAGGKSKGAQRGDLLRYPSMEEIERLYTLSKGQIIRWDAAPELPGALEFGEYLSKRGVVCSVAHTAATTKQAEYAFKAGFSHVTHCYNATTTYRKEGQQVLDGVVEAAYLNDDVVIELICDGCHIPQGVLRLALKIKGPQKVVAITDAMSIAGTTMTKGYLGTPECGSEVVVDNGVAKLPDFSCFAGSIATADRCLRVLVLDYGVDICTASQMLSLAPAKLHKLDRGYGSIEVGKVADLCIADERLNITHVILDGEVK